MSHTGIRARGPAILALAVLLASPVFAQSAAGTTEGPTFNAAGSDLVPVEPRAMSVPVTMSSIL